MVFVMANIQWWERKNLGLILCIRELMQSMWNRESSDRNISYNKYLVNYVQRIKTGYIIMQQKL
jgi:hypothetical protein